MDDAVVVRCLNNDKEIPCNVGTQLSELLEKTKVNLAYPALGAKVNNEVEELSYRIYRPKNILFFDVSDPDGFRMYLRSLSFVLYSAARQIYPEHKLRIEHSVSRGVYCSIEGKKNITAEEVFAIRRKMQSIVDENLPFQRIELETTEAIKIFEETGQQDVISMLNTRGRVYTGIYKLGDLYDYYYGYLVPSTGYLNVFDLHKYYKGMLLMLPRKSSPGEVSELLIQPKLFDVFREHRDWAKILGFRNIGDLNKSVKNGQINELIKINEALQEKKIADVADIIYKHRKKTKLILIAGPSSSGKTTFSKRLAIQLKVCGLKPVNLSTDDYFLDRENTPKAPNGDYDFESIHAVDLELFNRQLLDLMNGEEVYPPVFSFATGTKAFRKEPLKLRKKSVIIVEGIHGLNPELTSEIPAENKFMIYVSALTSISIDDHNRIPTTDNRLIRRIVRDYHFRHYKAADTIMRWPSVRYGEARNIFPYQEMADVMFNSALLYELGVLKIYAEPILKEVLANQPEYTEAQRLLKFLEYFMPISEGDIPPTSIMREFLGGSTFRY